MAAKSKSTNSHSSKKSSAYINAKPSAAILAAKKEAARSKNNLNKSKSCPIIKDIYQKVIDSKNVIRKNSGIVYDPFMIEHRCLWDSNYPECPERLERILERCSELGLINRCIELRSKPADEKDLLLKHTPGHFNILKSTSGCEDLEALEKLSSRYDAIYINNATYRASLLAAGSAIELIQNICECKVQNGMAVIRPPGHHAMKSEFCGYCFFNNVAIAAETALKNNWAKKILIVDWDVHHGQATQQMFYNDPRVVYFSIHRYENGEFWPNLKESDYHYVGEGPGEGYNFNVPLNKTGMTNADYLAIFYQILLPMAYEFQPDLIIVSAGYDAALGCPEGLMKITPACYAHLVNVLMSLANGKIAVVLEGGYCLKSLAESAALTLRALLGDPCPMLETLELPSDSIQGTILNVIYSHKKYWKCFQFQETFHYNKLANLQKDEHLPRVQFKGPEIVQEIFETRNCYPVQSSIELEQIYQQLNHLQKITNLDKAPNRVCIAYDDRMLKHYNVVDESHPEKPSRISSIFSKHKDYGLVERAFLLEGRIATDEEILLAHTQEYLDTIKATSDTKLKNLAKQASDMRSVYLHPETWNSASVSAGTLLQVVDEVLNNKSQCGVAIIRPPGHHAESDEACGFCIFNNVAIAAKYAVTNFNLKRVLIVDWDIHHGNGTQSILEDDPKILYLSIHRYDNGAFFPHSKAANYTEVGTGPGKGFNVNIPWNKKGMGDTEYAAAFHQVVMPIAYQYNPELVLVSAGFDACVADPLGGCKVTPEMYGHMTHWLSSLANGRIILTLEGGYNINSISNAMVMCTKALLGDPLSPLESLQDPCQSAVDSILNVLKTQKAFWPNLKFQKYLPEESVIPKAEVTRPKPTPRLDHYKDIIDGMASLEIQMQSFEITQCINPKEQSGQRNNDEPSASGSSGSNAGSSSRNSGQMNLLDYLQDNMQALVDEEMFAIVPLRDCPHLDSVADVPADGIDINKPCQECGSLAENWICLQCYTVHCARSINQHALEHEQSTQHPLTLSFSDLSVWCYGCQAYIDNPILYAARNAVHRIKFNQQLPWTYSDD